MDLYQEKCHKPIPIGKQEYAYQFETVCLDPIQDELNIRGWKPQRRGKYPYPNSEIDKVKHYDLRISRSGDNKVDIYFVKKFKDQSEEVFTTTISFSDMVNRLFEGHPTNHWFNENRKSYKEY